jgi:hypothetical protein
MAERFFQGRKIGRLIVLGSIVLAVLILISGCLQPQPEEPPSLAIMVESNIVEAGSSFMITGLSLNRHQKIWIEGEYRLSDSNTGYSLCYFEEEGLIYPIIDVPEDVVPGDYEVEIYIGKHFDDRELVATLPIHIQAKEK